MVERNRHDITFEILKKATHGMKKTALMTNVGPSSGQIKQYSNILLQKKLLEIGEKSCLKKTKKGLSFLEKCQ